MNIIVESGLLLCLFSTSDFSNALSIASIASIASCSAWLLEHLLYSLNCHLAVISLTLKITAPDPTPCSCLLPSVYTWIDVSSFPTTLWMYVFMYVCVYVCMYVCMYVCTYVCMYVCMYVRTYVCVCLCMYVCIYVCLEFEPTISAGERSQAARLLRSWVRIPPGAWIFVCCECRVLSGGGLCDELITRPEESYRLCCVVVCDLETSWMGASYIYDISRLRVKFLQFASWIQKTYIRVRNVRPWHFFCFCLQSWQRSPSVHSINKHTPARLIYVLKKKDNIFIRNVGNHLPQCTIT